jgi:hypothetical protein
MTKFDRAVEDLGNIVSMEHVNTRVPDQGLATSFYVTALGLTRDPYLVTGIANMWINVGRSQFHLPTGAAQVLRGHSGVVIPDRAALLQRLEEAKSALASTAYGFTEHNDYVEVTCPWGNLFRCYEPSKAFKGLRLGVPYVEVNVPTGTADGIARFYRDIMGTAATAAKGVAKASVGDRQELIFRETADAQPDYDGHHIAVYLADFSGPYKKLLAKGQISEESDQHQYRFLDIIDPDSGEALFRLEHEVRSMKHPLYARPLVNRNPAQSNRIYTPGHENTAWAEPAT